MQKSDTSGLSIGALFWRATLAVVAALVAALVAGVFGWAILRRWSRPPEPTGSGGRAKDISPSSDGPPPSPPSAEDSIDKLSDAEKQRLIDELGKQL